MLKFEDKKNYILMIFPVFFLCICNFFIFNADDLYAHFSAEAKDSLVVGNYGNYRYFIYALSCLLRWMSIDYFDNIIVVSLIYSFGLVYFCCQFSRYVGMKQEYTIFFCIAVAFHGFMADLSSFTMAYWNYGISWLAMGAALYCLRTNKGFPGTFAAIMLSVVALTSYQVAAQLLILAAGCAYLHATIFKPEARPPWGVLLRPVFVYGASCALFLIMKKLLGPEWGRPVHFAALIHNINPYFINVWDEFFGGKYSSIFPMHERFFYFISIIFIFLYLIFGIIRKKEYHYFVSVIVVMVCLAFAENPFNLPFDVFWPSPRSLTCASFLHAALLVFAVEIVTSYRPHFQKFFLYAGAFFLLLSVNNQARLFMERWQQTQRDIEVGNGILNDIQRVAGLYDGEKVAVISSWRNVAQLHTIAVMDYASSAFSTGWSPVPLLRKLSGADLQYASMQSSVCHRVPVRWDVFKVGDVVVVCMQ